MKKTNISIFAINGIIITTIFILNYFYQRNGFDFTLKCICSSAFALLGLINLVYAIVTKQKEQKFYFGMACGLILAMLGDVLIQYNFIVGAAVFACAHICFVIAYCFLQKMTKLDYILSAILFACGAAFLSLSPLLTFEVPIFQDVCIAYALIISLMVGKAVGNFIREKNILYGIIAVASVLFLFSDLMLVFDCFIGLWDWTNNACMGTYYPALCMLAFAMYLHVNIETQKKRRYN